MRLTMTVALAAVILATGHALAQSLVLICRLQYFLRELKGHFHFVTSDFIECPRLNMCGVISQ